MSDPKNDAPKATVSYDSIYKLTVDRIVQELEQIREWKKATAMREHHLTESLKALRPLAGLWEYDVSDMTLSNAVRFLFGGLDHDKALTVPEIKVKLEDFGYDLSKYENPLASIHTCVRRMLESEELVTLPTEAEDKKKKFGPGPKLENAPEAAISQAVTSLDDLMKEQK